MRLFGSIFVSRYDGCIYIGKPTCESKVQFGTAWQATKAAYRMEEKNPGETFDVYFCPFHICWHIGHSWEGFNE